MFVTANIDPCYGLKKRNEKEREANFVGQLINMALESG